MNEDEEIVQPWALIIFIVISILLLILIAFSPNISDSKKLFSFIIILFWTIAWSFILYYMWISENYTDTWIYSFMSIIISIIFVVTFVIITV